MTCGCGATSSASCVCRQQGCLIGRDWIACDMVAFSNAHFQQRLKLGDQKDESWNLVDATLKMQVRAAPGTLQIIQFQSPGEIFIRDAERRIIEIIGLVPLTAPPGDWQYDLFVTSSGQRKCRARGRFAIFQQVTTS